MFYLHLPSVFDSRYCLKLIEYANAKGFSRSAVKVHGKEKMRTDIRNNSRIIWEDGFLARELERAIKMYAGDRFPHTFMDQVQKGDDNHIPKELTCAGLGSHFRMYRYVPGEYFKPHKDGSEKQGEAKSLITLLIYLNNTIGGETVLMPNGFADKATHIHIIPKVGDVLLFQHDCWHEGRPVTVGEKYVLRTDIFYNASTTI